MNKKVRIINMFFKTINLILKRFNYILKYDYMNNFNTILFKAELYSEYISIIKVEKIPNETK